MSTPARHQVRQSFERAAATYDQAAGVQRLACKILAEQLPQSLSATPRLLDAGCGTGYALPLLQAFAPTAEVLALDLAPAMLRVRMRQRPEYKAIWSACHWPRPVSICTGPAWPGNGAIPPALWQKPGGCCAPGGISCSAVWAPQLSPNYARPLQRSMTTRTPSIFLLATRCCSSRKAQDFRRWSYAASALPCTIQTSDICCRR